MTPLIFIIEESGLHQGNGEEGLGNRGICLYHIFSMQRKVYIWKGSILLLCLQTLFHPSRFPHCSGAKCLPLPVQINVGEVQGFMNPLFLPQDKPPP